MSTDLIIGLVLIVAMIAYAIGAIVNNGAEALLGCLIPLGVVVFVFLGLFFLGIAPVIVVEWIFSFFE